MPFQRDWCESMLSQLFELILHQKEVVLARGGLLLHGFQDSPSDKGQ